MKSKGPIFALFGLGILVGVFAKMWFDVPSDQVLIEQALAEATRNGKEGKPGGVLDYLSGDFSIQGFSPSSSDVKQFIKDRKPEVTVTQINPRISGDTAEVVSPVNIRIGAGNLGWNQTVEGVKITLRRESGFRYGVFPSPRWKIVSVNAQDASLGNPFGI